VAKLVKGRKASLAWFKFSLAASRATSKFFLMAFMFMALLKFVATPLNLRVDDSEEDFDWWMPSSGKRREEGMKRGGRGKEGERVQRRY